MHLTETVNGVKSQVFLAVYFFFSFSGLMSLSYGKRLKLDIYISTNLDKLEC